MVRGGEWRRGIEHLGLLLQEGLSTLSIVYSREVGVARVLADRVERSVEGDHSNPQEGAY